MSSVVHPPLPSSSVEGGCLWPVHARPVLRSIEQEQAILRTDLNGNPGHRDGSGGTDTMIFQAGPYCLKTSRSRKCKSEDEGRSRLLALARLKSNLGSLVPQHTIVSLHKGQDGDFWLWTTTPWLPTLRLCMQSSVGLHDRQGLRKALLLYVEAILKAVDLALRCGQVLDVHPSNFVVQESAIAYVDDDVMPGSTIPTLGYAILHRVEEYQAFPDVVDDYITHVTYGFMDRFSAAERARLELKAIIGDTLVRSEAAQNAKQRILSVIDI